MKLFVRMIALQLGVAACSADRAAPSVPNAPLGRQSGDSVYGSENESDQIPGSNDKEQPVTGEVPVDPPRETPVVVPPAELPDVKPEPVPMPVPDPAPDKAPIPDPPTAKPVCEENKMLTQAKALTPSFALNGIAQDIKYELSLLCDGIAVPIQNKKLYFDYTHAMWFDSIGYEIRSPDEKTLSTGTLTSIDGVDLTGPRENWAIFGTASFEGSETQTKIILVLKFSRFTYESTTASLIHTYLRVGESKYIGVPLNRVP